MWINYVRAICERGHANKCINHLLWNKAIAIKTGNMWYNFGLSVFLQFADGISIDGYIGLIN